jgi:hypothetical protein
MKALYTLLVLAIFSSSAFAQKKSHKKTEPPQPATVEPARLPPPVTFVQGAINPPKDPNKRKKVRSLVIGNPMDCGIDSMRLFPVGMTFQPSLQENREETAITMASENIATTLSFATNNSGTNFDRNAKVEYISSSSVPWTMSRRGKTIIENTCDISNILFYNIVTGETYPLMKDTVHILSFAFHNEFKTPKIFYRVVKNDVNGDSLYTNEDDVVLYASDLNGKNLVQLTPDKQQLADYFYYPQQHKMLVKTRINNNGDKIFTNDDETNFYEVNTESLAMGRDIFSAKMRDALRVE